MVTHWDDVHHGRVRTLADYLRDQPDSLCAMITRIIATARECGPVELEVLDKQVVLHDGRRIFASVRASGTVLRGHLNLPAPVDDARLTKVEQLTKRIWFHRFALSSPSYLDETFLAWVRQATAVGQGQTALPSLRQEHLDQ